MKNKTINTRRRALQGITGAAAVVVWHKPIINSIVLPSHAETSPIPSPTPPTSPDPGPAPAPTPAPVPPPPAPPTAEELCPMVVAGAPETSAVSGVGSDTDCSGFFMIFSSDPATPLTIISITPSTLPAGTTVNIVDLGTATDSQGPLISFQAPFATAPLCGDFVPEEDVIFTVTATCDAVTDGDTFTTEISLSSLFL